MREIQTDIAVVGSGPGGALTAYLLAEAGRSVLLVEEGPQISSESCPPFSREELVRKYRDRGMTAALGTPPVTYVEACCVGGGSEVNSGLWHQPSGALLDEWRRSFGTFDLTDDDLARHGAACEAELGVAAPPHPPTPAGRKLQEGAEELGWRSRDVPTLFAAPDAPGAQALDASRRSMTRTYIPWYQARGGRLLSLTRAERLTHRRGSWDIAVRKLMPDGSAVRARVVARTVFLACGAIQTPALLQRSGIRGLVGRTLHVHPTVKVVATFPEAVNERRARVPAHQVSEFAPRFSFGCSISSPPHLALTLADRPDTASRIPEEWTSMAIYYAMTRGGSGRVRALPGLRDPVTTYRLDEEDRSELASALRKLCECLLAAGARELYPTLADMPPLRDRADLDRIPAVLPRRGTSLMTVHLFSSCRMGEDPDRCPVDGDGALRGVRNLYLSDASVLPGPPGVNPQGIIMTIVRRNVLRFLSRDGP